MINWVFKDFQYFVSDDGDVLVYERFANEESAHIHITNWDNFAERWTAAAPALRIIIEWPTKENAVSFMEDPEYAPHLQARTAGSQSFHFLVEAKDDLAS